MSGNDQAQAHLGALWTLLCEMRIEEDGAPPFHVVLAAEKGWSLDYAARVTREYRRFLYLASAAAGEITPSRAVDAAWHLHLTYSRHYWGELCGRILGRPLHHNPSAGGEAENERFARQYSDTLALYRRSFGETPPPDIWPPRNAVSDPQAEPENNETGDHAVRNLAVALVSVPVLLVGGAVAMGGLGAVVGAATGAAIVGAFLLHPPPPPGSPERRSSDGGSGCGGGFSFGGDAGDGGASCGGGGCGGCS